MPVCSAHRIAALTLPVALAPLALVACGGGASTPSSSVPGPTPSAASTRFPRPKAGTLTELRAAAPEGPIISPTVSLLAPGRNRFGFGLFDRAHKPLQGAAVAIYTAAADGTHVRGPFPARNESLAVRPAFRSRTTATDPDAARSVYVAQVPFRHEGNQRVMALVRFDGRLVASTQVSVSVARERGHGPPEVGQRAPPIHTPTVASVAGNSARIETRIPPAPSLLKVDLAQVLGRRPVILVFATPQFCASRTCGPVVDIEAEVQSRVGPKVAFIHQEIYRDNKVSNGFTPQVRAWRLPTEPWAFAIDARGRVVQRFEGAFSAAELERAAVRARQG